MSEPMKRMECVDYEGGHLWRASGYYLMRCMEVIGDLGSVTGTQMVGGPSRYGVESTPEVEVCVRCGLLRLRQEKQA